MVFIIASSVVLPAWVCLPVGRVWLQSYVEAEWVGEVLSCQKLASSQSQVLKKGRPGQWLTQRGALCADKRGIV